MTRNEFIKNIEQEHGKTYLGNSSDSFDENGKCINRLLPWIKIEEWQNAIDVSKKILGESAGNEHYFDKILIIQNNNVYYFFR